LSCRHNHHPEAESQEYIQAIRDNVDWLGWKPWKTTYSSEYFDELYEFALQLIKKGRAYVVVLVVVIYVYIYTNIERI
jgi:glutamyl/glutaminyl-tRNA synthetase